MDPRQCRKRPDGVWVCGDCGFAYDRVPDELLRNLQDAPGLMAEAVDGLDRDIVDRAVSSRFVDPPTVRRSFGGLGRDLSFEGRSNAQRGRSLDRRH